MKILMLGGTAFVGRAIVEAALRRDHEVTLFSRGQTGAELFSELERRPGDRATGDYASLARGGWDAVVDVSAYVPRHVTQVADALGDRAARLLFISTVSVYDADLAVPGFDETSPRVPAVRDTEEVTGATYGGLKVGCEDDVRERWGDRACIVRPGIVAGPHDPTDRFTAWARRAARGGRVALPGRPEQAIQVVDARDLALLVLLLLEDGSSSTLHAVGPASPVTLEQLILACAAGAGTEVSVTPVRGSAPALPLVLPADTADTLFRAGTATAHAAGLPGTPLQVTAADTLAWDRSRGTPALSGVLDEAREAQLLAAG